MNSIIAVDPGHVHVGVAVFCDINGLWECTYAAEMQPDQFLDWLYQTQLAGGFNLVVVESWKLFPQASKVYVGSDMPTSRLIGSIEAICKYVGDQTTRVVFQDPQIKVPTRAFLRNRGGYSVAKLSAVSGDHASDAELHGFKYLIDHGFNVSAFPTLVVQRAPSHVARW